MITSSELTLGLKELGLRDRLVIAHASYRAFGHIEGGAGTLVEGLIASTRGVVMPAFTYKTMITPEVGPENNGIFYGTEQDLNRMAEPFHIDMPVDKTIGIVPELLRKHPRAIRSSHPIQSFTGVNADSVIRSQTLQNPLAPVASLAQQDGWVLLLGVDHTVNTSIHYAEKLAGRKQFVRWALTRDRIMECPGFPGDSAGFNDLIPDIKPYIRRVDIGLATVKAMPLKRLIWAAVKQIKENPLALLCQREDCERCQAIRYDPALALL